MAVVEQVRDWRLNPWLSLAGVVLTQVNLADESERALVATVLPSGVPLLGRVPASVLVADAAWRQEAVARASDSPVALAYAEGAEAVLPRWGDASALHAPVTRRGGGRAADSTPAAAGDGGPITSGDTRPDPRPAMAAPGDSVVPPARATLF